MERARRLSQYLFAILANSYWLFPWSFPIYQGFLKRFCFPGLNCYSCPAAVMSCPIGAIQNFLATFRYGLSSGGQFQPGLYVIGSLGFFGVWAGRFPCGWICPFGLIQDLLFGLCKKALSLWRPLCKVPYLILVVFVILLPLFALDQAGFGRTWFCQYICPAGTLEAGLPLMALKSSLRSAAGWLFANKVLILLLILGLCTIISRPFCRILCPLGAIFGLFNRISWVRLRFEPDRCSQCKACRIFCPTEVSFFNGEDDINSIACIRCLRCISLCPGGAVALDIAHKQKEASDERGGIKRSV